MTKRGARAYAVSTQNLALLACSLGSDQVCGHLSPFERPTQLTRALPAESPPERSCAPNLLDRLHGSAAPGIGQWPLSISVGPFKEAHPSPEYSLASARSFTPQAGAAGKF